MKPKKPKSFRIKKLLDNLEVIEFKEKEIIYNQGDEADCCYFILSGYVKEFIPSISNTTPVMEFRPGDFVGAMKLVLDIPRTTTVIAASSTVKLAKITSKSYSIEIQSNINFLLRVFGHSIQRIAQLDQYKSLIPTPAKLHVQDDKFEAIQKTFRKYNLEVINKIHIPRKFVYSLGRKFFEEGDPNDSMIYIITEGSVSLSLKINKELHKFASLGSGDFFGVTGFTSRDTRKYTAEVETVYVSAVGFDKSLLLRALKSDPPLFLNVFRYFVTSITSYETGFVKACS